MEIGNIVQGHVNEMLGLNKDLKYERIKVCLQCPLYKDSLVGPICNSAIYWNPDTNDISPSEKEGYVNGCGCRLAAKTTLPNAKCPANKW